MEDHQNMDVRTPLLRGFPAAKMKDSPEFLAKISNRIVEILADCVPSVSYGWPFDIICESHEQDVGYFIRAVRIEEDIVRQFIQKPQKLSNSPPIARRALSSS